MSARKNGAWFVSLALAACCAVALVLAADGAHGAPPKEPPERVPAKQDRQPQGIEGVGLKAEQVNAAIDKGADFLWGLLKKELDRGRHMGSEREHLLYSLALVHANAHKRYPEFDNALRGYLTKATVWKGTYEDGLLSMLVESYSDGTYLPKLRGSAQYLLDAQGTRGTWTYNCRMPPEVADASRQLRVLAVSGGTPLDGTRGENALKRRTAWEKGADGDRSCTQYALLGLNSAARSGMLVPADTWQRNLAAHREDQNTDGGWGYERGNSYGSMTCAGICAVAIDRFQLGEKEPAVDESVERGLGWMAKNFAINKHPAGGDQHHYYYLYSLERVGRILDTEFIGTNEWYPLGAKYLVDNQRADGAWKNPNGEDEDLATSFALLFLTRATPSLKSEPKRGGDGVLKTSAIAPASRYYFILDASGSMLEEMDGKQKFVIARDAVLSLVKQLPPEAEVAVRVYGHRKLAIDAGADEDTQLLLPMAKLDQKKAQAALAGLRARGKTPLALSLREAAKDLASASAEDPVTVVLLTDGGEDTMPRQDPTKAADELKKLKGITLHVVGFDVAGRDDWMQQLQAIAVHAGGKFWPAPKADALMRQLRCAILSMPEQFDVVDMAGKPVVSAAFGEDKTLHEGHYRLRTSYGERMYEADFWINTGGSTAVVFDAQQAEKDKGTGPATAATAPPAQPPATEQTAPAAKKFCTECGAELAPGAKFCGKCGAKQP